MKRAIVVAASVPILLVTAWWTLALVFTGPDPAWLRTALAAVYALGTLAILLWLRPFARALAIWGLAFVALLIWWNTIRPSNEGDWQADVARLPRVEVRGEQLTVHNVRNFDYRTEATSPRATRIAPTISPSCAESTSSCPIGVRPPSRTRS